VRCFGSNKNQNDLAPDVIVASAVLDVPRAFVQMATMVRDGKFTPQIHFLGAKDGVVSLAWNDALKGALKPETVAEVERLHEQIRTGAMQVPKGF
jgi:basic membrane lipoprotein Med (substrate-binding protein (PBP1-ABC) superfamily)